MCIRDSRTAVPDDDVLVVRQPHALHEVVTKFRPVPVSYTHLDVYKRQALVKDAARLLRYSLTDNASISVCF